VPRKRLPRTDGAVGADRAYSARVNDQLYERLLTAARAREFVFYGAVQDELGIYDRDTIDAELAKISRSEVGATRPMLSSIVVNVEDHLPGASFFALGQELAQVADGEDEVSFALRQIKMTHDYWGEMQPFGERETEPGPDLI
jgi:hypothetical protein